MQNFKAKWHKSLYMERTVFVQEPDNIWFWYGVTSFPASLLPLYLSMHLIMIIASFGSKIRITEKLKKFIWEYLCSDLSLLQIFMSSCS